MKNVLNKENIKKGDWVKFPELPKEYLVDSVGGTHGNKVFCREIGHEVYAQCFVKVKRAN